MDRSNTLQEHRQMLNCIESLKSLTSLDPLMQEFIDQLIALAEVAADKVAETSISAGPKEVYGCEASNT